MVAIVVLAAVATGRPSSSIEPADAVVAAAVVAAVVDRWAAVAAGVAAMLVSMSIEPCGHGFHREEAGWMVDGATKNSGGGWCSARMVVVWSVGGRRNSGGGDGRR
ncbi:hypothetical protein Dimus_022306 [Dionaea muscipula]